MAIREFLSDREGVVPMGIEPSPTKVSYFIGNDPEKWRSGLTTYNAVALGEVCAGTTPSLKAYGSNVETICASGPASSLANPKEQFAPGESVYVWGNGLEPNTEYKFWIQEEGVTECKTLNMSGYPSWTQETNSTDASGTLAVTEIWAIDPGASATYDEWDIVADKEGTGEGTYNAADDAIDSASVVGFVTPIPELPTIILFSVGLLVLAGYVWLRKRF